MKAWLKGGLIGIFISILILQYIFNYWYMLILFSIIGFIAGSLIFLLFNKLPGPYLVRGGLIGLILGLVGPYIFLFIISIPEAIRENNNLFELFEAETMGMIFAFVVIPSVMILLILGIIIGAIVGKIKSRDKK